MVDSKTGQVKHLTEESLTLDWSRCSISLINIVDTVGW